MHCLPSRMQRGYVGHTHISLPYHQAGCSRAFFIRSASTVSIMSFLCVRVRVCKWWISTGWISRNEMPCSCCTAHESTKRWSMTIRVQYQVLAVEHILWRLMVGEVNVFSLLNAPTRQEPVMSSPLNQMDYIENLLLKFYSGGYMSLKWRQFILTASNCSWVQNQQCVREKKNFYVGYIPMLIFLDYVLYSQQT